MGLLYVSGARLHDDDAELIEMRRERFAIRLEAGEIRSERNLTQREVLRSLSEDVREAARVRAANSTN